MTITPQEAKKLNGEDRAEIQALEKKIDVALAKDFVRHSNRVCITLNYSSQKVRKEIERLYGEAGWDVKYASDQRDGDFFEFTSKSSYGGGR